MCEACLVALSGADYSVAAPSAVCGHYPLVAAGAGVAAGLVAFLALRGKRSMGVSLGASALAAAAVGLGVYAAKGMACASDAAQAPAAGPHTTGGLVPGAAAVVASQQDDGSAPGAPASSSGGGMTTNASLFASLAAQAAPTTSSGGGTMVGTPVMISGSASTPSNVSVVTGTPKPVNLYGAAASSIKAVNTTGAIYPAAYAKAQELQPSLRGWH